MARGFSRIGYHAVVLNGYVFGSRQYAGVFDGQAQPGRPAGTPGAHALGYNSNSLGVCMIGRDNFSLNQLFVTRRVIQDWMRLYDIPIERVIGHYEVARSKTCPNIGGDLLRSYVAGGIVLPKMLQEIEKWNRK